MSDEDDEYDGGDDMTDEEFEILEEAQVKRREQLRGRSETYTWMSPVGLFAITFEGKVLGEEQWRLSIMPRLDYKPLGKYLDHTDAMMAVIEKKTGWKPWDKYDQPVAMPDSDDWSSH